MGLDKLIVDQQTVVCTLPKGDGFMSALTDNFTSHVATSASLKPSSDRSSKNRSKNSGSVCRKPRSALSIPDTSLLAPYQLSSVDRRRKELDDGIRFCARGRPRRKSSRKTGNNHNEESGKKSGDDKGERKDTSRSGRGSNHGRGNGGNDDDRGKKDDENDDDNDDEDDDDNNEEEEEEGEEEENNKKETGTCDLWNVSDKARENEESVLEDMLRLVPSADLNCEPPDLPAKPGSLVNLHGVVVHETAGGLVILNVRWRNKVYSGAFIDIKKNKWPADRLDEEIPTNGTTISLNGKEDSISRKLHGKKGKRNSDDSETLNSIARKKVTISGLGSEPLKCSPSKNGKRIADQSSTDSSESEKSKKRTRILDKSTSLSPSSPPFIECPEPNCDKRYRHVNGLKYHQAHAHQCKTDTREEENKSIKKPGSDSDASKEKREVEDEPSGENLIKVECIKKEEVDIPDSLSPKKTSGLLPDVKEEKMEDSGDWNDNMSTNGDSVIVDVEQTSNEIDRKTCTPAISVENVSEDKDDKGSEKSCESGDSCGRIKPDRISLLPGDSMYGLLPLMPPYFPSYLQHSPTLGSLNPQTLNNSLSSALQPSRDMDGRAEDLEVARSSPSHNKLTVSTDSVKGYDKGLPPYAFSNQLLSRAGKLLSKQSSIGEEIVVASDEENVAYSPEALPGCLETLFVRSLSTNSDGSVKEGVDKMKDMYLMSSSENKSVDVLSASAKGDGTSPRRLDLPMHLRPSQTQPTISSSLFQQLSQERLNTQLQDLTNQNSNSDLAAPADIQQALSKVDIRRHFSPMLLNYLKPCRSDLGSDEIETLDGKKEASINRGDGEKVTQDKLPIIVDGKPPTTSASSRPAPTITSSEDPKSISAASVVATNQLQPNISVGRPISRPVQKQESITGGPSASTKFREDHGQKSAPISGNIMKEKVYSKQTKDGVEKGTSETVAEQNNSNSNQSTAGKENIGLGLSSETAPNPPTLDTATWAKITSPTSSAKAQDCQSSTSSSASERNFVEAKTWVPQEIYPQNVSRNSEKDGEHRKQQGMMQEQQERDKTPGRSIPSISTPHQGVFSMPPQSGETHHKQPSPFGMTSVGVLTSKSMGNSRGTQPVPIAPAPVSKASEPLRLPEKTENDTGARDVPQISRFTLTSDNRLVPSPAENRGRPRKVRVEKTQQIPIGTAHDVEVISRIEERPKKQSTACTNIVRASVIHSMAPSTTPQKSMFSGKEASLPSKELLPGKGKPVSQDRGTSTPSEKGSGPLEIKRRSSFESHGMSSHEKRVRVDNAMDGSRTPDYERDRSKFKSHLGEASHTPYRSEDRSNESSMNDDKKYHSASSRPSSAHSGRASVSKDDSRPKFPGVPTTPLPTNLNPDIMKPRMSLAESSYLGLHPQFIGQFVASQRMHPGNPYSGLYLNPAVSPFHRELMNEQLVSGLNAGLRDEGSKGTVPGVKERFERDKACSPGEGSSHSLPELPSPRDHLISHQLAKQHPSISAFGKSTPDPARLSRDSLRTGGRNREQSPIFIGGPSAPGDPGRGLRPTLESTLPRNIGDRPLFGGGPQYLPPHSPSLVGRLRPDGPPDITNRPGQGRIHDSLLESGRLRRDFSESSSNHSTSGPATSRPTFPQPSPSAGPALYPESMINRQPPFMRSGNLILSRADGAILGPLPYDGRQPDGNQR